MGKQDKTEHPLVKSFGVTPEKVVGYAYAGLLAAVCLGLARPDILEQVVEALGLLLSVAVAFAIGIGIYAFYFNVIGEFILYPFQHTLHFLLDLIWRKTGQNHTCDIAYLGYLGVPIGLRRQAYETLKSEFYELERRRRIQLAHGEIHVLYLTFVELIVVGIYLVFHQSIPHAPFLFASLIVYFGALIADIKQHSIEAHLLKAYNEKELRKFLIKRGFIKIK